MDCWERDGGGGVRQLPTHCSGPSVLTSKYKPVRRDEGREGTNSNRNHTQMNGNGTGEWGAAPTVIEIAQKASVQCKHALLQSYRFVLHHVRPTETPLHSPPTQPPIPSDTTPLYRSPQHTGTPHQATKIHSAANERRNDRVPPSIYRTAAPNPRRTSHPHSICQL